MSCSAELSIQFVITLGLYVKYGFASRDFWYKKTKLYMVHFRYLARRYLKLPLISKDLHVIWIHSFFISISAFVVPNY